MAGARDPSPIVCPCSLIGAEHGEEDAGDYLNYKHCTRQVTLRDTIINWRELSYDTRLEASITHCSELLVAFVSCSVVCPSQYSTADREGINVNRSQQL